MLALSRLRRRNKYQIYQSYVLAWVCIQLDADRKLLDKLYNICIIKVTVMYKDRITQTEGCGDMSNYELQIRATEQYYDEAIRAAEQESIEILSSVVPGSRLHQVIHNPVDSGIDEG